jgi:hypothetical protein
MMGTRERTSNGVTVTFGGDSDDLYGCDAETDENSDEFHFEMEFDGGEGFEDGDR